jgi:hypothetical protein
MVPLWNHTLFDGFEVTISGGYSESKLLNFFEIGGSLIPKFSKKPRFKAY